MDEQTQIFEENRSSLFRLAYGMLGRVASAKDAVQEAYLRWQKLDPGQIDSPGAYLSTMVHRICLDELKSARNRREQYIGPDLPEPLVSGDGDTPARHSELADSLSLAMLVLLQKLTPVQRAVFLLREVFDYNYAEIAPIIDKTESHCRKIAQRARELIRESHPRFDVQPQQQRNMLESFMEAVREGDISSLEEMLSEEATLYSDGGGKVTAARKPVHGANNIARFMVGIRKNTATESVEVVFKEINGQTGMLAIINGKLHSVWSFDIRDEQIQQIFIVLNPDKLEHIHPEVGKG